MCHRLTYRTAVRSALALAVLVGSGAAADAAFTVMVNGVIVATDEGVGDRDTDTGIVRFVDTVGNLQIRLTTGTEDGVPGGNITTPELQVFNTGTTPATVEVSVTGTFGGAGGGAGLANSLTRNRVAGYGTSGTVESAALAVSMDGGTVAAAGTGVSGTVAAGEGQTTPVLLAGAVESGTSAGSFVPTSEEYQFTQTITITDLLPGDAVSVTAASETVAVAVQEVDPGLVSGPVPPSIVLLGSGLVLTGIARRRFQSR